MKFRRVREPFERMPSVFQRCEMMPVVEATQELWKLLVQMSGEAGLVVEGDMVLVKSPMGKPAAGSRTGTKTPSGPRYLLQRGFKAWRLVFNGVEAAIKHGKGIVLVACLLLNPSARGIHGTELAALATGQAILQEATLKDEGQATEQQIKRLALECMEVIKDPLAGDGEKQAAQKQLEELAECRKATRAKRPGSAEKLVRAMRLRIDRLIRGLRAARDANPSAQATLRAFGDHLHQYLWIPSSRYGGSRRGRTATGTAGRFTYEPPAGVRWHS